MLPRTTFGSNGSTHGSTSTTAAAPTFGAPIYFDPAGVATTLTTTAGALAVFGHAVDRAPVNTGDGTFQVLVMIAAAADAASTANAPSATSRRC